MQNLASATQSLMSSAASMEGSNQQYQMAIYTFNNSGLSTIQALTSNLANAQGGGGQYQRGGSLLQQLADENEPEQRHRYELRNRHVGDQHLMPLPGTGTPASTPQEVLFIVSDGVDDEVSSSCSQTLDGNRCQQPFNTTWCTTIKNRGIQIAVLYTDYLPLPTNSWYNNWIAPFQNQIAPNMESCASPGMFFSVTTDGDITAAMQTLFQQAVAAARLTH